VQVLTTDVSKLNLEVAAFRDTEAGAVLHLLEELHD
jgi:hypothetical protein